jgi:peptidoglycan-N-acetylglucosamine deacetylase
MFYLHHTPWWLRRLFPKNVCWQGPVLAGSEVYLTFDDGPHPEATPFVLEQLARAGMKATFFCIGKNVEKYPELYQRILDEGHAVGNHTMHHVNGRQTAVDTYIDNIRQAGALVQSCLFRPPYGQITQQQAHALQTQMPHMQVVMWSVLSGDFDTRKTGERCAKMVERHTQPGSLIVFHDSTKAWSRLQVALPLTLQMLQQKGWRSMALC